VVRVVVPVATGAVVPVTVAGTTVGTLVFLMVVFLLAVASISVKFGLARSVDLDMVVLDAVTGTVVVVIFLFLKL